MASSNNKDSAEDTFELEADKGNLLSDDDGDFLDASDIASPPVRYCYPNCRVKDSARLIACDGSACGISWYHIECVGVKESEIPEGDWYCPTCDTDMKMKEDALKEESIQGGVREKVQGQGNPASMVAKEKKVVGRSSAGKRALTKDPFLTQHVSTISNDHKVSNELRHLEEQRRKVELEIARAKLAQAQAELSAVRQEAAFVDQETLKDTRVRKEENKFVRDMEAPSKGGLASDSSLVELFKLFSQRDSEEVAAPQVSDGKITWKQKSGMYKKNSCDVKIRQSWPQLSLKHEYRTQEIEFMELSLSQFVAGEVEIIAECKDDCERSGRLKLLRSMMYDASRGFQFKVILQYYAAYVREIEIGGRTWADDFSDVSDNVLKRESVIKHESGDVSSVAKISKIAKKFFCWDFNHNACQKDSPHGAKVKGVWRQVHHICGVCLGKNKGEKGHAEMSS